jgi:hypothetical protein
MMNLLCPMLLFAVLVALSSSVSASTDSLTAVDLGLAEDYSILAGSAITTTGGSDVMGFVRIEGFPGAFDGKVGVSPGSAITGVFRNGIVTDAANDAAALAKEALLTAYNEAAGKNVGDNVEANRDGRFLLSGQDLGGMTLAPGVYKFSSTAALNGVLKLDTRNSDASAWTFQIESSLLFAGNSKMVFTNTVSDTSNGISAVPGNADRVTWQVGSSATIMGGAHVIGNILAYASITANSGARVNGRLLARTAAVTIDSTVVCSNVEVCTLVME